MRKKKERKGTCAQCGECCKKLRITTVLSHIIENHGSVDEARIYYSFRGMRLTETYPAIDRALLELDIPCNQLSAENTCMLHDRPEQKPLICHKYPWFQDDIPTCGFTFE